MNDVINTRLRRARFKRTQAERRKPKDNGAFWANVLVSILATGILFLVASGFAYILNIWLTAGLVL